MLKKLLSIGLSGVIALAFMSYSERSAEYREDNDSGFVPIAVVKTNVRLREGPSTQSKIMGQVNPGFTVVAEKWLVRDDEAKMSWYRIVGFIDTKTGRVDNQLGNFRAPCYVSADLVQETSYSKVGYSEDVIMEQLALTPYGQGYSAVDASPETQRRMAEQKTLKQLWIAEGVYERTIPIYAGPSKSSGELKGVGLTGKNFHDYDDYIAVDASQAGWLHIVDVMSRCPSGWVEANLFDLKTQYDYVRIGKLFTLNLGANVPDILRRWGPGEVVERKTYESWKGYVEATIMSFDGLEVLYEDYRNFSFTLTRKGAGLGGIFVGVSWCNKDYIEKTFGKALEIQFKGQSNNGDEYWTLVGGPDGWHIGITLYFDKQGIVQKLQYECGDVNLS